MALKDQLVAHWSLEEASGSRADDIGGNTLTDNNTVTQNPGKVGNAAQFTAANSESLSIADNAALSMADIDFTLWAWVYLDSKSGNRNIVSKLDAGNTNYEYFTYFSTADDRFHFGVSPNGTPGAVKEVVAATFGSPALATWSFVVAWHDSVANTLNIQVNNGAVDSTAHSAGVFNGIAAFQIGRNSSGNYWDGRIDQVGLAKRVLSSAERSQLYNGGNGLPFSQFSGTSTLAGAGTPQAATGSGAGLGATAPVFTLGGSAAPQAATGSGAGLRVPFVLAGSAAPQPATGSGAGLAVSGPRVTLSGSAIPQAAAGSGAGLRWVPVPSAIYVARPRPRTFVGGDH